MKARCKTCGEIIERNVQEQHLKIKHPEVLDGIANTNKRKDKIHDSFVSETAMLKEANEELAELRAARGAEVQEMNRKREELADLQRNLDAEKAKMTASMKKIVGAREGTQEEIVEKKKGVNGGEEMGDKVVEYNEGDEIPPPGDWLVDFLLARDVSLNPDEIEICKAEYNAYGLPDHSRVAWILTNIGMKPEKIRRITSVYSYFANQYLETVRNRQQRNEGFFGRGAAMGQPRGGVDVQPPVVYANPQNPPQTESRLASGWSYDTPVGEHQSAEAAPQPHHTNAGGESPPPDYKGGPTDHVVDVVESRLTPIYEELSQLKNAVMPAGVVNPRGFLRQEQAAPTIADSPEIIKMVQEFQGMKEAFSNATEAIEEEKRRRLKEAEYNRLLDDLEARTDKKMAPLFAEINSIKTEGGGMKGLSADDWLKYYDVRSDKALEGKRFEFEQEKWKTELDADRDFKGDLVKALSGAGDLIGSSLGEAVAKNMARREQAAQSAGVPPTQGQAEMQQQTFAAQGIVGDKMIAIPCPTPGCGNIIKADKDAKIVTCMKCGQQYELGQAPPVMAEGMGQTQPPVEEAPSENEGKIRIVDRETGEPPIDYGAGGDIGMADI